MTVTERAIIYNRAADFPTARRLPSSSLGGLRGAKALEKLRRIPSFLQREKDNACLPFLFPSWLITYYTYTSLIAGRLCGVHTHRRARSCTARIYNVEICYSSIPSITALTSRMCK